MYAKPFVIGYCTHYKKGMPKRSVRHRSTSTSTVVAAFSIESFIVFFTPYTHMHADSTALGEGASHFDQNHYQPHSINDSQQSSHKGNSYSLEYVRLLLQQQQQQHQQVSTVLFKPSLPVDSLTDSSINSIDDTQEQQRYV